jgi:preprotein translocase subunit SecG
MTLVLSIIHVLACVLIIAVILLQSGRGGGLGAGFGGASSAATQLFGGRGAGNFLSRSTVALAAVFMVTSLGLAYLSSRPNSLLDLTETAGSEGTNEDTIVERGSGPLVPLDEDGSPLGSDGAASDQGASGDAAPAEDSATKTIDVSDMLKMKPAADDEAPAADSEEAPAADDESEAKPEAKPEPKPEAKPEPKPEAKPEPKPEAKPEPKPEKTEGSADDSASDDAPTE